MIIRERQEWRWRESLEAIIITGDRSDVGWTRVVAEAIRRDGHLEGTQHHLMINCIWRVRKRRMFPTYTLGWMAVPFTELTVIKGKLSCWGWKKEMSFELIEVEVPIKYPNITVE